MHFWIVAETDTSCGKANLVFFQNRSFHLLREIWHHLCICEATDISKDVLVFQSTCKYKMFLNFRPVTVMQVAANDQACWVEGTDGAIGFALDFQSVSKLLESRVTLTQFLLSSEIMGLVHFLMGRCWQVQLLNVWSLREWNGQCRWNSNKVCPCH